ncbi:MAG TPA: thioredoxin family protein [Gemmatimonadaceae bacterium]|nr:thioredoxin family protein [Gemmatimonadaceae bacterium]
MQSRFLAAPTFAGYLAGVSANPELWTAVSRRARVAPAALARAAALPGRWHLLAISEDWCGDAVNSLPYIARLAELAPGLELRVVGREANPDLMSAHLTNGARSIPVVIAYDESFVERGWWGPRPGELQAWVLGPGRALEKAARYREVRRWYARDGGLTTIDELLAMLEAAAAARDGQAA